MAEDGYVENCPEWPQIVSLWDSVTAAVKLAGDERDADDDLQRSRQQAGGSLSPSASALLEALRVPPHVDPKS